MEQRSSESTNPNPNLYLVMASFLLRKKSHFKREEFVGRISDIVYFVPFSKSEVLDVVEKELEHLAELGRTNLSVELTWTDELVEFLSRNYNQNHGARSIQ